MAEIGKDTIRQFLHILRSIPTGRKISLALSTAVVVAGFVALLLWVNRPDYQVLFANLETADASRITQKLAEKKTPYQLKEGGSAILVPSEMVYQLRLEMAGDGLPRGQNVGFEIFNDMPFGTTEFVQRLKYKQALQGELARTIMGFDSIAQARVHIVPAGDSLFAEDERPATASVVLRLHGGRSLDSRQIQGIINLVARAVEGLKPDNVTVVEMSGGLLSKGFEEDHATAMSKTQFDYQQKLERSLQNRIQTMLEPVVGTNKVVARVSAEVDFERVNLVEEKFDPDKVVVRSEQRQKESSGPGRGAAAGSPDLQAQIYPTQTAAGSSSARGFERENATVNYEINKVSRQVTNSVGDVKRLSAAVIIDGPYVQDKGSDGKMASKFIARNKKDMKVFEDIVKKAIGFTETRGDQVSVSNIPFVLQEEERMGSEALPWWMDYGKKATKPVFNLLLVCLFLLLTVKPFRRWIHQTGQLLNQPAALPRGQTAGSLAAPTGEQQAEEKSATSNLLEISKGNPEAVAHIIRQWISEGR
ncbi:MAG: flagellar M-ring protein FliF [Deltaproteobacteria bacterium HGW-Deltaproteobacteria-21]|nr:MAG: flagellar M-ring protein FliF [Deltaproteobacteria bacterium HGW-Deltaproteobacteria-21]